VSHLSTNGNQTNHTVRTLTRPRSGAAKRSKAEPNRTLSQASSDLCPDGSPRLPHPASCDAGQTEKP
jgi:hypothetical protein